MPRCPRCPYCNLEIHLESFFELILKETSEGDIEKRIGDFKGEQLSIGYKNNVKMWVCPSCDKILGFSEYKWDT